MHHSCRANIANQKEQITQAAPGEVDNAQREGLESRAKGGGCLNVRHWGRVGRWLERSEPEVLLTEPIYQHGAQSKDALAFGFVIGQFGYDSFDRR